MRSRGGYSSDLLIRVKWFADITFRSRTVVRRDDPETNRTLKIIVCPLSRVEQMVETHHPERVVSLLDPGSEFPDLGPCYRSRHLRLQFHDAHDCVGGQVAPAVSHVHQLLNFVSGWMRSAPIIVHCRAGIGRSSAAGFIAACLHSVDETELEIAHALRRASSLARPNELLAGC